MELGPSECKTLVKKLLKLNERLKGEEVSYLLLGPPGVGKSEAVIDAAKEYAKERGLTFWIYESKVSPPDKEEKLFTLVLLRLDMIKPEDLTGIPEPAGETFDYKLPRWAVTLRRSKGGLLFLDEFTNVHDDTLMSAAYEVVLQKSINMYKFGKPVVAAGNPPEYSSLSRPLPAPLLTGRLAIFKVREPTLQEWLDYMHAKYGDEWLIEVYTFLDRYPQYFLQLPQNPEGLESFPTPRAWTKLAKQLYEGWRDVIEAMREKKGIRSVSSAKTERLKEYGELISVATALVGGEAGLRFVTWLRVKPPSLKEVKKDPRIVKNLTEEQKYMLAAQIASNDKEAPEVVEKIIDYDPRIVATAIRLMSEKRRKELLNRVNSKVKTKIMVEMGLGIVYRR